jgi:hypothetical protein
MLVGGAVHGELVTGLLSGGQQSMWELAVKVVVWHLCNMIGLRSDVGDLSESLHAHADCNRRARLDDG